ncbi:MAG: M28 family peptidase, partial [Ketobacter sp.]|nr:M28 family peptidase [Ketobacter sp.]
SKWSGILPDKFIATIVSLVSQQNIQNWVNDLAAYHTRHTKSIYINQVATWLVNKFQSFNYNNVTLHQYSRDGYQLQNVVCTKPGVGNTGQVIILCGHYDCCMENLNDATARAPGADDNATGIAVMLVP